MATINKTQQILDSCYTKEATKKTGIVVHHTVGGTALSSIKWWNQQANKVSCPFIIERDGTIYQTFESQYWSYHLGLRLDPRSCVFSNKTKLGVGEFDKKFIGVELASEGGLTFKNNKLYAFDGQQSYSSKFIKLDSLWRGFQYFDDYEDLQLQSLYRLINKLIVDYPSIQKNVITKKETISLDVLKTYSGVCGHHHFRTDKTDPHFNFNWDVLAKNCGLVINKG